MHQPRMGLVIADRARAKILVRHGSGELEALQTLSAGSTSKKRSQGCALGRESGGRHACGVKRGQSAAAQSRFASAVAEKVNALAGSGAFQSLVLVATPKMLGAVERRLSRTAKSLLAQEFTKDLTRAPRQNLIERFGALATHPAQ